MVLFKEEIMRHVKSLSIDTDEKCPTCNKILIQQEDRAFGGMFANHDLYVTDTKVCLEHGVISSNTGDVNHSMT